MSLLARLLGVAALALAVAACSDGNGSLTAGIYVDNQTTVALHFTVVRPDGRTFPLGGVVPPGTRFGLIMGAMLDPDAGLVVDRCIGGPLVAYAPDGAEVARHDPPLCASSSSFWVIGGKPSPSTAPS